MAQSDKAADQGIVDALMKMRRRNKKEKKREKTVNPCMRDDAHQSLRSMQSKCLVASSSFSSFLLSLRVSSEIPPARGCAVVPSSKGARVCGCRMP